MKKYLYSFQFIFVLVLFLFTIVPISLNGEQINIKQSLAASQEEILAQAPPTGSTVCGGSQYCIPSISPFLNPSNIPSGPQPIASISAGASPIITQAPCTPVNYQSRDSRARGHHHHHKNGGSGSSEGNGAISGMLQQLLNLIMQLLNQLIALLGGQALPINPTPSGTLNPSGGIQGPSGSVPVPSASVPNPCLPSIVPSQPISSPSGVVPSLLVSVVPSQVVPVPSGSGTTTSVQITFYGAYDNDPAGSTAISHPVIHQTAGGVGSYQDPLTFAAQVGAYAYGTIIYVPTVQKYFILEDDCASCVGTHVDLYVGNPSVTQAATTCENSLTPSSNGSIILNPPSNLTYDATPIWSDTTGKCMTPH